GANDKDCRFPALSNNLSRSLDAVHPRHYNVHDRQVRRQSLRLLYGLDAISRLCAYLPVIPVGQQPPDCTLGEGAVVGNEQFFKHRHATPFAFSGWAFILGRALKDRAWCRTCLAPSESYFVVRPNPIP